MSLFFQKSIDNVQPTSSIAASLEAEPASIGYNEVLDYLVALHDDDYEKLLKVANIYRRAERQVADVLNPTSTDTPEVAEKPEPKQDGANSEVADEIDGIIDDLLETDKAEAKGDSNNG